MKTLIGMREFVLLEFSKRNAYYYQDSKVLNKINNYANFLSRQPQLSDFVPCGEDGLPLIPIESRIYPASMSYAKQIEDDKIAYQQALDKVLFKGFEVDFDEERNFLIYDNGKSSFEYWIVNDVLHIMDGMNISTDFEGISEHNLELTENGKNTINAL